MKNNFDDRLRLKIIAMLDPGGVNGHSPKVVNVFLAQIKAEIAAQMPKRIVGINRECSICKFLAPEECSCYRALKQVKEALQLEGEKE